MSRVAPRTWCSLMCAVLFAATGCGRDQAGAEGGLAGDSSPAGLTAQLRKAGFQVNPGYPVLYTQQDCTQYTYPVLKNCLVNNPAAPYVMPILKAWPDEYVDPVAAKAFGGLRPGYSGTYRLDPRDAVVLYGTMPPPGRYMGVQTWEFSRDGQWRAADYRRWERTPGRPVPMQYLFDTIPPDRRSGRVQSVSALGDTVNDVVMRRQSGYSFGTTRYVIITPSATTDRAVRRVLQASGVPGGQVFTEQIPARDAFGPIGPLGMGKNAVDFLTAFRYAVPDPGNERAADRWRKNPPLTVMRVRAPASLRPVQRYGPLTFAKRTANSEAPLAGGLRALVSAVCNRVRSTAHLHTRECGPRSAAPALMVDPVRDYGWTGPYCRKINMNCLGDQQDAAYFLSRPLPLDAGQVYAVVGTLATATGNATYAALSVNDPSLLAGVANVLDTTLKGSAAGYASTVTNSGTFFVHYFTRDCAVLRGVPGWPKNCTAITDRMLPPRSSTSAEGDPALHGMFMASLRDYVKPGTARGPASSKLLTPRVLTFTARGR